MDNQFVHLMGSPYLIVTGIGEPVEDAKTSINISKDGEFDVIVVGRGSAGVPAIAAARMGGLCDGTTINSNKYGKGWIFSGISPAKALKELNVSPVVKIPERSIELAWIQRKTKEADILPYF